jgi:hypothetical protein
MCDVAAVCMCVLGGRGLDHLGGLRAQDMTSTRQRARLSNTWQLQLCGTCGMARTMAARLVSPALGWGNESGTR